MIQLHMWLAAGLITYAAMFILLVVKDVECQALIGGEEYDNIYNAFCSPVVIIFFALAGPLFLLVVALVHLRK